MHDDPQTFLLLHHIYCLKNGRPTRALRPGGGGSGGGGTKRHHHHHKPKTKKLKAIGAP